jgi:predicted nucleic-acid-binding protein
MIAIDTNILVRLLVDDPGQPEQVRAVRILAQKTGAVYVPTIVLVECVWVLDSAYHFNKSGASPSWGRGSWPGSNDRSVG